MKKIMFFIVSIFMITACSVGNVSRSGGMENQGYLQFIQGGSTVYSEGVTVTVDNLPPFTAKVDRITKFGMKANTYAVKTGTRHLQVAYQGKILYEKNVIIVTQETKQIQLP
ncbi:MAG: hypothetical protein LBS16_03820 [Prevotellaceae bacterium]|jgi:hypothetical protein|nr:hypothetical protein [Prevotellaceae bacterium]